MIAGDCIGYGMKDGRLLFIADVPRGLACACVCARCGRPLVARKGSIRRHHFAHVEVTKCRGAVESVLHSLAKELLAESQVFVVPSYQFVKERRTKTGEIVRHEALVAKGGIVDIHNVRVEEAEGDFVPDIVIETGSKSLIVEVAVTHKVERAKLRRMRRRELPAVEIRLDPSDSLLSRESLKRKLQCDLTSKVWLFHPAQRAAERVFVSKFRDVLTRRRAKVRQSMNPDRFAIRSFSADRLSFAAGSAYDRTAEEFRRKYRRYPTMEECLRLWPHLWRREP